MRCTEHILIVGAGAAGATAAGTVRRAGYAGAVTVVSDEPDAPYNRTTVNKALLQGILDESAVVLPEASTPDVSWVRDTAVDLDLGRRRVALASGSELGYDALLVATGTHSRTWRTGRPSTLGDRVVTLRTMQDTAHLRALVAHAGSLHERGVRVAILGAGLIGSETASVLHDQGVQVHLVSMEELPMEARLGQVTARWLAAEHRSRVQTYFGRAAQGLREGAAGELLLGLDDGSEVTADILVVSTGVVPSTKWLARSGIDTSDGVEVDQLMRVRGAVDVYAAGDLARVVDASGNGHRTEHWTSAVAQGRLAALSMLRDLGLSDEDPEPWTALAAYNTRIHGHKLSIAGRPELAVRSEVIDGEPNRGRFTVALSDSDARLVGLVGVGSTKVLNALTKDLSTDLRRLVV